MRLLTAFSISLVNFLGLSAASPILQRQDGARGILGTTFYLDGTCTSNTTKFWMIEQAHKNSLQIADAAIDSVHDELEALVLTIKFDTQIVIDYFGPPDQSSY